MMANPTRVAMDELQLKDLQNMEAAVEVKQNATPAKHEDATVPKSPVKGRASTAPMMLVVVEGRGELYEIQLRGQDRRV